MGTVQALGSDLAYVKQLFGAGLEGMASARQELHGRVFAPRSKKAVWTPAALGCALGILSTRMTRDRKSMSSMAFSGLLGTAVGFGAAGAWASRHYARIATRRATRLVNAVRDERWLEKNPINYA